jgi:CTP:molybdopterin cytidylyltransferase MocA
MRAVSSSCGIVAVILAAGTSRRLGRPKQSLQLGGETLLERAVRVATGASLLPVIVVVAEENDLSEKLQQRGCRIVLNEQAEEGMAASIRCGIEVAQTLQAAGAVLMTCDQVAVRPEHLCKLYALPASVTGSRYAGKVGIPAYFPVASFTALMELRGDVGAREMLTGARAVHAEGLGIDIDTAEDFAKAQELFEHDARQRARRARPKS